MKREYPEFNKWKWYNYNHSKEVDLEEFVLENLGRKFFIGTDAQNNGIKCRYTTVCSAYSQGKGGAVIFHNDVTPRPHNLRDKLLNETLRTIELAWYLQELVGDSEFFEVHMDINPNKKFESNKYHQELAGMVTNMGFKAVTKPHSWAATHAADKKTK